MAGFGPMKSKGGFALPGGQPGSLWRLAKRLGAELEPYAAGNYHLGKIAGLLARVLLKASENRYSRWVGRCDTLHDHDRQAIRKHIQQLGYQPLISIILPVYNTPERWLRICLDSVVDQLYPHWELCIADDASTVRHCRAILEEYQAKDARIKVAYRNINGNIAKASNSALELASGDFLALLDHDDKLSEHALYMVALELNRHPDAHLIYSDEDKIDRNEKRQLPYFKPDWNPDLFFSQNFINHLGVYRTSLVRDVGGFRNEFVGSQDYDLALRIVGRSSPEQIRHIPYILYHWRAIPGSVALSVAEKADAQEAGIRAVQSYLDGCGIAARVEKARGTVHNRVTYSLPALPPSVSIIIPTAGRNPDSLAGLVEGILTGTDYPHLDLTLVPNHVESEAAAKYLYELGKKARVQLLPYDKPFNFSEIYNFAVPQTSGQLLGILNDDLAIISPGWLREMVSHAVRGEIGAVGAMLYYRSDLIQHAGVILGRGGIAAHAYRGFPRGFRGHFNRAALVQNCAAVTAACMVMRREVFNEVGGFDPNLAVAFNDVDLCIRIRTRGYRIVWTPYAELYHLESVSRGRELKPEQQARLNREGEYLKAKWGAQLAHDPFYSPNLSLDSGRFEPAIPPRVSKPWRAFSGEASDDGKRGAARPPLKGD